MTKIMVETGTINKTVFVFKNKFIVLVNTKI